MAVTLTAEMIYGFTQLYLKHRFDGPVETPECHLEWWDLVCTPRKYVAIAAPRGHAKSTAITHAFTLAAVCFRIKKHVLIISDTKPQAIAFLGDLKAEFLENEELIKTFGVKELERDREDEIIIRWLDGGRTRIVAKGSEQSLRGIKWRNQRPDLIVGDDLENDEIVLNDERRFKFRQWYFNALLRCGSRDCWVRIVGTILHLDSLLMRLMPDEGHHKTVNTPLCMFSTDEKRIWLSVLYRAHPSLDNFNQILWEEMWPEERLREERQTYIDDNYAEGYAQEFLNSPVDDTQAYFRRTDFLPIPAEEFDANEKCPENFYCGVDLAISEKDTRAYTVFTLVGLGSDGKLRVRDVIRRHMDGLEINETFFEVESRWGPGSPNGYVTFCVEDENIRKALKAPLEQEMDTRGVYLYIEPMPPIQDKLVRARPLQSRMRAGGVEFDMGAEWYPAYEQELLYFPRAPRKDQVDSTAWVAQHLKSLDTVPTQGDLAEEEYWDEYWDAEESWGGRNWITGY